MKLPSQTILFTLLLQKIIEIKLREFKSNQKHFAR